MLKVNCAFRLRISMVRTIYEKSSTCIWKPSRPRQRGLIIAAFEVDGAAKTADLSGLFATSTRHDPISSNVPSQGKINDHERVLPRESSCCSPLDRHAVQLSRHARFRFSIPERAVRDDRARGRWPSTAAGLQHGECQSRGRARVLLDQGAGRPTD